MTITKRSTKGSALTYAELDENFRDLDSDMTIDRVLRNGNTTTRDLTVGNLTIAKVDSPGSVVQVKHMSQPGTVSYQTPNGKDARIATGLSITITPKYADSEIYIDFHCFVGNGNYQSKLYLHRVVNMHSASAGTNSAIIGTGNDYNERPRATAVVNDYDDNGTTAGYRISNMSNVIVDRPNTTDPVTYYLMMGAYNGQTIYLNRSQIWQYNPPAGYDGVPSSNMRVMEVVTDHTSVASLTHVASSFVEMPSSPSQIRQIQIPSTAQVGDIAVLWGWADANAQSSDSTKYFMNSPNGWTMAVGNDQQEDGTAGSAKVYGYIHGNSWVKVLSDEDEIGFNMTLTSQSSLYMSACMAVFRPDKPITEFYIKNGYYKSSASGFSKLIDKASVIPVSALVVGLGGRYSGQNPVLTGTDITVENSPGSVGDPKYGYKIYNSAANLGNQTLTTTDAGRQAMNAFYLEVV